MVTPRDNLLKIFRHEMPEWIPICGHIDPYNQPDRNRMDPELSSAMGTVQWHDESTILFSRYLGIDIMDYMPPPVSVSRKNVTVQTTEQGDDTTEIWRTPVGDLQQVRRRCREDGTSYLVEHMVKNANDLPVLAAIFEDEVVEKDPDKEENITKRQELISTHGMLMCFMPGTPMGMMYRVFCGVEALAYLYIDAPQTLKDLFSVMETNYQQQFKLSTGSQADIFVGMDDTSTTVISPSMFEQFNLEVTDQRSEICHEQGRLYFHHSCGLIRDLLPLYRRTVMDAVHAFTIPPVGNVTVAQGRPLLGDRITVIAGAAPLADEPWDPESMQAGIRQMFQDAAPGDHFILNLAAYPHRTMEQTQAVVDECRKYQTL